MTRMLADLKKVNCYNRTFLNDSYADAVILESAKTNLLDFAFFGLVEEQRKTQFLFERTLGLRFIDNFEQRENTHVSKINITQDMLSRVTDLNSRDVQFYEFAKELFYRRVKAMEAKLNYTVEEYFSSIREVEIDDEFIESVDDHVDGGKMFEDETEEESWGKKQESYPTKRLKYARLKP